MTDAQKPLTLSQAVRLVAAAIDADMLTFNRALSVAHVTDDTPARHFFSRSLESYATALEAAPGGSTPLAVQPVANPTGEDDDCDAILFRFWIRAASFPGGFPSELSAAIGEEIRAEGHASPAAYRRALIGLAKAKGVNLPGVG